MKFNFKNLGASLKANTLGGLFLHLILAAALVIVVSVLYFYAYLPHITNHGESITVPSVEGLPITKVEEFLASHDLRYEVNDSSYSAEYPPLTVLKQYPAAGATCSRKGGRAGGARCHGVLRQHLADRVQQHLETGRVRVAHRLVISTVELRCSSPPLASVIRLRTTYLS